MTSRLTQVADLDNAAVMRILDTAKAIKSNPKKFRMVLEGKILGLMFFEPSTRTYFSFASAAQRGGGNVLGFNGVEWTSMVKGESLEDTARMMAGYADVLVCRHSDIGISEKLSRVVNVPIINAGEGAGEHPTQALTDLFTLREHHGRLDIKLAIYGDLRFGRTTHSLIRLAARFGAEIYCVAPDAFQMPSAEIKFAENLGAHVHCLPHFTPQLLSGIDALYVTRIQKERLPPDTNMGVFDEGYVVDAQFAEALSPRAIVMHPLPRVNEIATSFDSDPRAAYFTQAANGVPVRLALLKHLLKTV
jgi:aspartate carbamoyltransferase catalytic subunit